MFFFSIRNLENTFEWLLNFDLSYQTRVNSSRLQISLLHVASFTIHAIKSYKELYTEARAFFLVGTKISFHVEFLV